MAALRQWLRIACGRATSLTLSPPTAALSCRGIHLSNREVVDWSVRLRRTADFVLGERSMIGFRRRPEPGVLFHSDRGSQYASHAYQADLIIYGMCVSMSRKGNVSGIARPRASSTALSMSGFMECATRLATRLRAICFQIAPCSTTGAAAIPLWYIGPRPRSCITRSNFRIGRKWPDVRDSLNDGKRGTTHVIPERS